MKHKYTAAWNAYEAGRNYKRKIGFYENARQNERFYRGDQWSGVASRGIPTPVFNIVRRITDYLTSQVAPERVSITYTDENLNTDEGLKSEVRLGTEALTRHAAYLWERNKMDTVVRDALLDAALTGDGVFSVFWDPTKKTGQAYEGEIVTVTTDAGCLFPADVNEPDIQSQEYIILSGRDRVSTLRREAEEAGVAPDEVKKIIPDCTNPSDTTGDLAGYELESAGDGKATWLLRFYRENGFVVWEKSTRYCVIKRVKTSLTLYPLAKFSFCRSRYSFHGTAPASGLVPNQRFINKAYSMVMKHMMDSAFSKVIYDKARIPEWTNEVGEAIGVVGGGGNVGDTVSVVGTGKLEDGYLELIQSALTQTKEMAGATDAALGNVTPNNTSAIITLQEASTLPLSSVRMALVSAIEDLANIWSEMAIAYYAPDRMLAHYSEGDVVFDRVDYSRLKSALLRAKVDVTAPSRYSQSVTVSTLDRLLEGGFITFEQYLERIPDTVIPDKYALKGMSK